MARFLYGTLLSIVFSMHAPGTRYIQLYAKAVVVVVVVRRVDAVVKFKVASDSSRCFCCWFSRAHESVFRPGDNSLICCSPLPSLWLLVVLMSPRPLLPFSSLPFHTVNLDDVCMILELIVLGFCLMDVHMVHMRRHRGQSRFYVRHAHLHCFFAFVMPWSLS